MESVCKATLNKNRVKIIEKLQDLDNICDYFISCEISTNTNMEHCQQSSPSRPTLARKLIDILIRRPANDFAKFIYILKKTKNQDLAKMLKGSFISTANQMKITVPTNFFKLGKEIKNYESETDSDDENGATQNNNSVPMDVNGFYEIHRHRTNVKTLEKNLENSNENINPPSINDGYDMSNPSPNKGSMLIININEIKHVGQTRFGSETDCFNLKELFEKLGWTIDIKSNLLAKEILDEIKCWIESLSSNFNSCALVVMSHGNNKDEIFASDGDPVKIDEIKKMLISSNCPAMKDKPKLMIFQCCRSRNNALNTIEIDCMSEIPIDHADIIVAYSTIPDYASYRDPVEGSYFIQDICSVFHNEFKTQHVCDMLTHVKNRVSDRNRIGDNKLQLPIVHDTLRKKWYLNP